MEKWKYDHNIELQLVSLMTRKALRIRDDAKVDALAEDFEPDGTSTTSLRVFVLNVLYDFEPVILFRRPP